MIKICQCEVDAPSRNKLLPYSNLSSGDSIVEIARLFINTPYKAGMLESAGKENLVINWSAFDCTTFVETVLAFAKCIRTREISHHYFRKNLKLIRYRQGKIDGYSSRLHYFTDWLRDNENKKLLSDISRSLGGKPQRKKINFMTFHCQLYPALQNKTQLSRMVLAEKKLSRKTFYIIAKDKVTRRESRIHNGDIIAFATDQQGLDVAHVGFAIWQGKSLRLLHASSKEGAVVISKKTLAAYLKSNKKFNGIIVTRPKQFNN
ncbi:putative lipoprotein [hydrocarbon metagenome]|uniref:Putative lipoprotein n=1 Tax=hydrocarbon metagenome TaxID=938273 RepID=A0A0W8FQD0_9ZZZZ